MEYLPPKNFQKLTTHELYQILQLRNEVFILEQNTPYQDIDNKDENAFHFLCISLNSLIGYGRIFFNAEKNAMSIGRLVTKGTHRNQGIAKKLMKDMLKFIDNIYPDKSIVISAQTYLEKFYQSFNFMSINEKYLEDGLPHIAMIRLKKG